MAEYDQDEARALSLRGVRPPVKVPGYEQEAFLGKGAYGEVWVAVDSNSGRKVAIKYYTRRGGTDWAALAREVEKLRYLFNDRYVVQLLKVGWEAEPPYYVMEYMENGSLEDQRRGGPCAPSSCLRTVRSGNSVNERCRFERRGCPWPCESPRWWPRKVLAVSV